MTYNFLTITKRETNMENVINTIAVAYNKYCTESAVRRARIETAWKEQNNEIPPTVDRNGRFHAPCDGYTVPDNADYKGDYSDHVFGAGEYLPVPLTEEDDYFGGFNQSLSRFEYRQKVKCSVSLIESIASVSNQYGFTVTYGKVWEQAGIKTAYAYITGIKRMVTVAAEAMSLTLPVTAAPVATPEPEVYLEGKHLVRGTIVHTKVQESFYGFQAKMLVKTEQGHKLWGTLPSCVDFEYRGEVEFSATFEKGTNGMSYYKRPTKVKVLSEITA